MVPLTSFTNRWPRTPSVLGVGITFFVVPSLFPLSRFPVYYDYLNVNFITDLSTGMSIVLGAIFLVLMYLLGEIMIEIGNLLRSKWFMSISFDKTFSLVAKYESVLLADEFERIRAFTDLCGGLSTSLLLSIIMRIADWDQFTKSDWLGIILVISFSLLMFMMPYASLISFERKLDIYRNLVAGGKSDS